MPPLKAQLLLAESLAAYFPEMVFTDSGITVQLHQNTHLTRQPSCRGKLVSLLRLIGLPSTITTKLTTDSRWMNPELFGNAGL